jgi:hypothetical protein
VLVNSDKAATKTVADFEQQQGALRAQIINRIMEMKDGTEKTTAQPDAARAALRWYADTLPWLDLVAGVRDALKAMERQT